jgi:hypothetical protein
LPVIVFVGVDRGISFLQAQVKTEKAEQLLRHRPRIFGKSGTDSGAHNLVAFDPQTSNGAVVLTNRSANTTFNQALLKLIETALA